MEKLHKQEMEIILELFAKNLSEAGTSEEEVKELVKSMKAQYVAFRRYAKASDIYARVIEGKETLVPTHQQIQEKKRVDSIINNKKDV